MEFGHSEEDNRQGRHGDRDRVLANHVFVHKQETEEENRKSAYTILRPTHI